MTLTDQQASAVLKANGRSFYFASHLLSKTYRNRAARLYAFCRYVDDLADENNDKTSANEQLQVLMREIEQGQSTQPCVSSMIELIEEVSMPIEPVQSLIKGVQSDLSMQRISTEAELIGYAYNVAGTVGLMMCMVLDVRDQQAWPHAIDLGIAMQLTNIARDVGQDAQKNRIYIPGTWLGEMNAQDILKPSPEQAKMLKSATKHLLSTAEHYYASGLNGAHYLPRTARYGIVVAAMVYREIGQVIRQSDFCSWDRRAVVSASRKVLCASKALSRYIARHQLVRAHEAHDPKLHQHLKNCFGANTIHMT